MTMRLHLLSDLHFEFQRWRKIWDINRVDADVHVLAGDIGVGLAGIEWALRTFRKPVIYVMGNHEYYGQRPMLDLLRQARKKTFNTHVHVLENDSVVIGGTRFLGCTLWTDFALFGIERQSEMMAIATDAMGDYSNIRLRRKGIRSDTCSIRADGTRERFGDFLTAEVSLQLHRESRKFLEDQLSLGPDPKTMAGSWKKTVVVTHHAPWSRSLCSKKEMLPIDAAYASHLDNLLSSADLWLHGHVHVAREDYAGDVPFRIRVATNCRGYTDYGIGAVPDFAPHRVIEL